MFPNLGASRSWEIVHKFDKQSARLADRHYSRRKPGAPQWMPPGETLCLRLADDIMFGWWRPHPSSGIRALNDLDGWTCTIFRNESPLLSSALILLAEYDLREWGGAAGPCGPDGLITYVWDSKIKSKNPGACFKHAGWRRAGRSADGRKTLLRKPWEYAGVAP